MKILIQKIKTEWTKKSRGNPGATRRNRVLEYGGTEYGVTPS